METIKIDEDKLLVILQKDDMAKIESCDEVSFLNAVFDRIAPIRLPCEGKDVKCEVYESKDGGCEIFITAACACDTYQNTEDDGVKYIFGKDGFEMQSSVPESRNTEINSFIYRFDSLENMLAACREISNDPDHGASSSFADPAKDIYYLILEKESFHASEFNGTECPVCEKYYIAERCSEISYGTVEKLRYLAI